MSEPSKVLRSIVKPKVLSPYQKELEAHLSREDWEKVYSAYSLTGKPQEISDMVRLDPPVVKHLIRVGITRLGLPPIKEHATDLAKVNHDVYQTSKANDSNYSFNLPEVQEAVSNRATLEAVATKSALESSLQTAQALLTAAQDIVRRIQQEGTAGEGPVKLTELANLSKAAQALTGAVDKAVRLSRYVAGEPEQNVALQVSTIVMRMTPEQLRSYKDHGVLDDALLGFKPHAKRKQLVDATATAAVVGTVLEDIADDADDRE